MSSKRKNDISSSKTKKTRFDDDDATETPPSYLRLLILCEYDGEIIQYKIDMKYVIDIDYLEEQSRKDYGNRENQVGLDPQKDDDDVEFKDCFQSLLEIVFGEDYPNSAGDEYDPFVNNKKDNIDYTIMVCDYIP